MATPTYLRIEITFFPQDMLQEYLFNIKLQVSTLPKIKKKKNSRQNNHSDFFIEIQARFEVSAIIFVFEQNSKLKMLEYSYFGDYNDIISNFIQMTNISLPGIHHIAKFFVI